MATTNTTATAPELTADQVLRILTEPLETASTFLASGVRIYDTSGPLRIPSAPSSEAEALGFTGEAEAIPEREAEFGEVSLLPSTMESVKVLARYSNELARQSVVNLEAALRDRLVRDVAARIDAQFYSDSGDGVETPRGMFAWEGTQSIDPAALDLDAILDAQALALAENVDPARLRLFVRPEDYMVLRKAKDGDSRYMLEPDARRGDVPTVLGLPVTITPRIPEGRAAVADPAAIAVARDLSPTVKVLSETFAATDEQAVRVVARYDVAPVHPAAIVTVDFSE